MRPTVEGEPNPVVEVIGMRTLQVSAATIAGLAIVRGAYGPYATRRIMPTVSALAVGGLSSYFVATFHPRTNYPGTPAPIARMPWDDAVALTFDDGPFPGTTPRILDILSAAGARATFFLVGESVAAHPALARRIAAEGHAIGIHGNRHRTMALQSATEVQRELSAAQRAVEQALGQALPARLLRPPYGFASWTLCRTAAELGWRRIAWSLDSRDYAAHASTDSVARRLLRSLRPGEIVLLHERPHLTASVALNTLPILLRHCRDRGWGCRGIELQ